MFLGNRQDIMVPDHREIGVAEIPPDVGRTEHVTERLLNSLLNLSDLASENREPAAGGIEHDAPAVEAPFNRDGKSREFTNTLPKPAESRKLVAVPGDPLVEVADGAERLDRLGQFFRFQDAPDLGTSHKLANVVQSAEGRSQSRAECFDHLSGQRLPVVNFTGVDARLDLSCRHLAQRAAPARGNQRANLFKVQKLERMTVHIPRDPLTPPCPATEADNFASGSRPSDTSRAFAVRKEHFSLSQGPCPSSHVELWSNRELSAAL